ncbi:uncharacterized protein N7484_000190 [Penicillium longicatenatum]|uniref:uncharacterized protein n=1 Tax=Penicillium longicatenatum TaxID=1561947 RepID=UPI002546F1D7|nr:uncharacterized protein N7484_000190 [Penicillium longicatenatum]KAJ5660818.1 hypothetical protein N7484_000190 [Penicillium longicatenatum]
MRGLTSAITALLLASPALGARLNPPSKDAILLSNVNTLTLRANRMTSSRRVSPIPQLTCVGPSKKICDLYQPEVMRCTNQGYDYDEEDVQWTCEASLPSEFKLGATDVICEGYRNANDKYVLKGSCGVEYRMLLTEQGEKRFGLSANKSMASDQPVWEWWMSLLFFTFTFGVFGVIIWQLCCGPASTRTPRGPRRTRGWFGGGGGPGGGGGGGGGGGYDPYSGPPPAYGSWWNSDKPNGGRSSQGWTPGFWTGALGGAAAGYGMGRRRSGGGSSQRSTGRYGGFNAGEGSSRSRSPPRFSSPSSSTGFGSTKRR